MYISKETFFKIAYIVITVIHLIMYFILFYKLHKLKGGKSNFLDTVINKGKELITTLLKPENSIVSAFLELIEKSATDDEKKDGGENG